MSHSNPTLSFTRPILRPNKFSPKRVWTDGDFIYRYDPERGICKRSPINPEVSTGSMFFDVDQREVGRSASAQVNSDNENRLIQRMQKAAHPASRVAAAAEQPIAAPLLRSALPPAARALIAGLGAICLAAAAVIIYPLWPAVSYDLHQLHPASFSLGAVTPGAAAQSAAPKSAISNQAAGLVPMGANRLIVPKIGINTPIVEGSSLKVLNQTEGVWHQTGDALKGNLVLAGHRFRYLPPNTSTLYDLNKVQVGDIIVVDWLGSQIVYHVVQTEVVPASDVGILNPTATPHLTLYSCNDVLMTKRVVAIAVPFP